MLDFRVVSWINSFKVMDYNSASWVNRCNEDII